MTPAETQQLHELLDRICDRLHTADDMRQLNALLSASAEARHVYRQVMDLHGRLMWEGDLGGSLPIADLPRDASAPPTPAPAWRVPRLPTRVIGTLSRPRNFSVLVATVSLVSLLAVAVQIRMPGNVAPPVERAAESAPTFVATFVRGVADEWPPGALAKSAGLHLRQGEQIALRSGLAEIALRSGTRLILEGPAVLQLEGTNAVHLASGSLVSRVPPPAQGFVVRTPTAHVVDRGTEFGVYVDADQATETEVFSGRVEVTTAADPAQAPVVLRAGEALRFTGSTAASRAKAPPPRRHQFVRMLPDAGEALAETGSDGGLLLVKNLTTSEVLFADDFEPPRGRRINASRPPLPNNGPRPGKWRFPTPAEFAVQVVDARSAPDAGPAQGKYCLRLLRAPAMADADALFHQMQSTPGDVIHFEAMLYIPRDAEQGVAQVLFRAPITHRISVSIVADEKGHILFYDSTPGLADDRRYRDSGLTYEPDQWQKWELDYQLGSHTATIAIDAKSVQVPIALPSDELISVGLRVGNAQKNPKPFYVDAVPAEPSLTQ